MPAQKITQLANQSLSRAASRSLCSRSLSSFLNCVEIGSICILSGGALNRFSCKRRLFLRDLGININFIWFLDANNFCPIIYSSLKNFNLKQSFLGNHRVKLLRYDHMFSLVRLEGDLMVFLLKCLASQLSGIIV
jgi:hypothetical protein